MNDARSVAELVAASNPGLAGRIHAKPRPVSLTRTAGAAAQRKWIDSLRGAVAAYEAAQGPVLAVVVHRDADDHDPRGEVEARLNTELSSLARAHGVVPVQMTEAWWFLFPDAVELVRPRTWRGLMPRKPSDVERIIDPKKKLKELTRRGGTEYAESDSVTIAKAIRERSLRPVGTSASYERFVAMARRIKTR